MLEGVKSTTRVVRVPGAMTSFVVAQCDGLLCCGVPVWYENNVEQRTSEYEHHIGRCQRFRELHIPYVV